MSNVATVPVRRSIIVALAERYGMEAKIFEATIRATVLPAQATQEEFAACLLVAHEHNLNPITREIYFMRTKAGGIQPIVGVDGWASIINRHPQFDGMEFTDNLDNSALVSITCRMFRKDRQRPVEVTEYMIECRGQSQPWQKCPNRLLRHRTMIQCARYAFGFAGIMERDEFDQWQAVPATPKIRDVTPKAIVPLPDIPDVVTDPVRETDQTAEARDAIATAISVEMLEHIMDVFGEADWTVLEDVYTNKMDELKARAA